MFTSLGLFNTPCPDDSCNRPKCIFNHGEPSRPGPKPKATSKPALSPVKRHSEDIVSVGNSRNAAGGVEKRRKVVEGSNVTDPDVDVNTPSRSMAIPPTKPALVVGQPGVKPEKEVPVRPTTDKPFVPPEVCHDLARDTLLMFC